MGKRSLSKQKEEGFTTHRGDSGPPTTGQVKGRRLKERRKGALGLPEMISVKERREGSDEENELKG